MNPQEYRKVVFVDTCEICGQILKDDWSYCPYCKSPVIYITCSHCKKDIKKQWQYCPHCRNKINIDYQYSAIIEQGNNWLNRILKTEED